MSDKNLLHSFEMTITAHPPVISEIKIPPSPQPPSSKLPSPSYTAISVHRSGATLFFAILGNSICSAMICICLWSFSKQEHLTNWEKRVFNTLSLLLSAALTLGIGFLCDRIGVLGRGAVLQQTAFSVDCIGYIMEGTIASYALIFIKKPTLWVVFIYLTCSVLGPASISILGFSYALDENLDLTAPMYRPDWLNCTVSHQSANNASKLQGRSVLAGLTLWELSEIAQRVEGPYWSRPLDHAYDLSSTEMETGMDLSLFASDNLLMEVVGKNVVFRYQFRDFSNARPVFAQWEAIIETKCQGYKVSTKNLQTDQQGNVTWTGVLEYEDNGQNVTLEFPGGIPMNMDADQQLDVSHSRWIQAYRASGFGDNSRVGNVMLPPHMLTDVVEGYWFLTRSSANITHPGCSLGDCAGDGVSDYVPSNPLLYRCNVVVNDTSSDSSSTLMPWNSAYAMNSTLPKGSPSQVTIFGRQLYEILIRCFMFRMQQNTLQLINQVSTDGKYIDMWNVRRYYDWPQEPMLNYGTSRQNKTASELWLAAYIGNYIGNTLSFLNDHLRPIKIQPASQRLHIKLVVRWGIVAATLGWLLLFQVFFSIGALLFCKGKFEIPDNASTLSIFGNLPLDGTEDEQRNRQKYEGYFVQQGERREFQWVFKKKQN